METFGQLKYKINRMSEKITRLNDRVDDLEKENSSLSRALESARKSKEEQKSKYELELSKKDAIINELKARLAHEVALNDRDGTNTGLPTSMTPLNKNKVIPNSRQKSDRNKGGQKGHQKAEMKPCTPDNEEADEVVRHEMDSDAAKCDHCGINLVMTGETICKNEFDVKISVVKKRHEYSCYVCPKCGKAHHCHIDNHLKEKNQYGPKLQALCVSLMVNGNVAINKVRDQIHGMTDGMMNPSEGFIAKLMKRCANKLGTFCDEIRRKLIVLPLLYWDDTVVMVMTKRACLRFYGDERLAYYVAHERKDLDGIKEDGILNAMTKEACVMHDHNTVNYNDSFCFTNIECNQHLQRDLQKVSDENPEHTWAVDLKKLVTMTIRDRTCAMNDGRDRFDDQYIDKFNHRLDELIEKGREEDSKHPNRYATIKAGTLLDRLEKYSSFYFMWVTDFKLPTTNNLSERALRGIKSHMKISGQFENVQTAENYAIVKSYVETCRRNGINELTALTRLVMGNPYTLAEILG